MFARTVNFFIALLSAALAASAAHASSHKELPVAPIYTPATIAVPAGTTVEEVKKAVRKAMFSKDWLILDVEPGQLQGKFRKLDKKGEKYNISVDIKYDAKGVSIGYQDSAGLNYRDGLIHKTYGARVRDLEKAIRAELGAF